jgi:G:T-mismatch repair DNA endonuclease (very short patch repair protein)
MEKEYKCPQCSKISLLKESSWKEAIRLKRLCRSCAMKKWQDEKYGKKEINEFTSICPNCKQIKTHTSNTLLSATQVQTLIDKFSSKLCYACSNSIHYILSGKKKNTKPEREFKSILKDLNIKFKQSYKYKGYYFDFYIPKLNVLIEIDGVYWHGKGLNWDQLNETQRNSRLNDERKNQLCLDNQIPLIRLWENDFDKQTVINIILSYDKKRTYDME